MTMSNVDLHGETSFGCKLVWFQVSTCFSTGIYCNYSPIEFSRLLYSSVKSSRSMHVAPVELRLSFLSVDI